MKLIIGNKNYSSWSLRPWLLLKKLGIEFEEMQLPLMTEKFYQEIAQFSGAAKVPVWVDKAIEKAVHINPGNRFSILSEFDYALNKPDSSLINNDYVPLIKRNPVRTWQIISLLLVLINFFLIYQLNI